MWLNREEEALLLVWSEEHTAMVCDKMSCTMPVVLNVFQGLWSENRLNAACTVHSTLIWSTEMFNAPKYLEVILYNFTNLVCQMFEQTNQLKVLVV